MKERKIENLQRKCEEENNCDVEPQRLYLALSESYFCLAEENAPTL